MCGICGIYNFDKEKIVNRGLLERMNNIMRHRGPDDEGYYVNQNIGFGHRRLSIIDLSTAGHQPMSNEDGSIWITYNGEIYNYLELKEDLTKKGHQFKSRTDTEVIIHLYEEEGEDCVLKLNGMFAFAIWDDRNKKLFIARDHVGIKPLYYTVLNERVLFASEIKSILQDPEVKREVNLDTVHEYFTFIHFHGDKTFFKGIKLLPAGHILIYTHNQMNIREYWDVKFIEDENKPEEFYIDKFLELFTDSIKRQMVLSDVPVATYLSGGMDSGSVTTIARKVVGKKIKSFSCGFDENPAVDERKFARIISSVAGTEHHDFVPKVKDFIEIFPDIVWHIDEPRAGASYPPYLVARLASSYAKVILAGHGGDELFAGYHRHLIGSHKNNPEDFNFEDECYRSFIYLFHDNVQGQLFSKDVYKIINKKPLIENIRYYLKKTNAKDYCNKVLYVDMKTYMHGLLVLEDKISMAHSLETRVPFLDKRLIDFATKIPPQLKIKNGILKYITRTALSRFLPPIITQRSKMGFGDYNALWWRREMKDLIYEILLGDRAKSRGYFNYTFIKEVIDRHMSGERNYELRIWSLLNFELWHRIFIDEPVTGKLKIRSNR